MAYQQSFKEDDKNKPGQQPTSDGQILGDTTGNVNSPTQPATAPARPQGSGFTNLTQYIDANADQSKGMADQVTGKIEEQVGELTEGSQKFKSGADKSISEGIVTDKKGVGKQLANNPSDLSAEDYTATQQGYQGPKQAEGIKGYSDLNTGFEKVGNQAKGLSDFSQRQSSAKDVFGGLDNQYTQGENLLDTFLLGAGEGGQAIKDYQQSLADRNVQGEWNALIEGLNKDIGTGIETSTKTAETTKKALDDALKSRNNQITNAQSEITKETELYNSIFGNDSRARMQALYQLGLSPDEVEDFERNYKGNGLQGVMKGPRSLGDFINPEAQEDYEALLALSGGYNPYDFSATGSTSPLGLDKDMFNYYRDLDDILSENPDGFGGIGNELPLTNKTTPAALPSSKPIPQPAPPTDKSFSSLASILYGGSTPKKKAFGIN